MVLNVRLDQQSFATARQRMAAILTLYGDQIFDTRHPVAQRADLAAMIGTSRVMMSRTLRGLEADGLVKRHHGGGISILDHKRLARLSRWPPLRALQLSDVVRAPSRDADARYP